MDHEPEQKKTMEVHVPLGDEELTAKGQELARVLGERNDVKDEAAEAAKGFRDRIKVMDERIDVLADQVNTKREKRHIPVSERRDARRFCVETVRHDTLEVVATRAMTKEEVEETRQGHLFEAGTADSTDAPPTEAPAPVAAPVNDNAPGAEPPIAEVGAVCGTCGEANGHRLDCDALESPEVTAGTDIDNPSGVLEGAKDGEDDGLPI